MTHTTGAAYAVSQMKLLPKEDWLFKRLSGGIIAAGIFDNSTAMGDNVPTRYWLKYKESDLPNDFISQDDLECFMVDGV